MKNILVFCCVFLNLSVGYADSSPLGKARVEAEIYAQKRVLALQNQAPNLAKMFQNTFLNPIVTTSQWQMDGSLYLITGSYDVVDPPMKNGTQVSECWSSTDGCPYGTMKNNMWLRDAFGQWMPYFRLVEKSSAPNNEMAIKGLLYTAAKQIGHSSYANAFRSDFEYSTDQAGQGEFGVVAQNTYEPDSLMWVVWGAWKYAKILVERGDAVENLFGEMDDFFVLEKIVATLKTETMRAAMRGSPDARSHQSSSCPRDYLQIACADRGIKGCTEPGSPCRWIFDPARNEAYCTNDSFQASYQQWSLGGQGLGQPLGAANCSGNCALTWSAYRPSDDLNRYGYNIPVNMMAVVTLNRIIDLVNWLLPSKSQKLARGSQLLAHCRDLAGKLERGIQTYGITTSTQNNSTKSIYVYETDAIDGFDKIDDANIPSLLSMKYFGYEPDEKIWFNTYEYLTSHQNPFYFGSKTSVISGVGSCHTAHEQGTTSEMVWPMATMIQAQLEGISHPKKAAQLLWQVVHSTDNTFFMHESVSAESAGIYTRGWFAWANGLFAEIVDGWLDEGASAVLNEYFKLKSP